MLQLRTERLRRGWSQTHVTGLTGIATSDLSAIERGIRPAYPGWRRRIARAFDMSERDLFKEADDVTTVGDAAAGIRS